MPGRMYSRATLAAAAVAVLVASPAAAAPPRQLVVPPSNPYRTLLTAQSNKALSYGARVGTCTFVPHTSCAAVQLSRQQLSGAFAPFGDFQAADLAGSSLAAAFITHTNFRAADHRRELRRDDTGRRRLCWREDGTDRTHVRRFHER
jgi:hypothetical protein